MDAHPDDRGGRAMALPASPAQIVAIGLVAAALLGGAWIVRERPVTAEVPLLDDTTLTAAQSAKVEAALDRAGLTAYRTEAGRVWVPRAKQSAYKRAVVDADAIPRPWGTRFHDALKEGGVWASAAARAESLRVARQDELALVLMSMPGIERASVMVDEESRSGFHQETLKTASVGIHGAAGAPLDAERARAVRVLVASSVAGLEAERVAVTDLSTGRVFSGPLDASASPLDAILARTMALESAIAGRARQALVSVPGALVTVSIGSEPPPLGTPQGGESERRDAAANAPAEVFLPAAGSAARSSVTESTAVLRGRSIDVAVSVPEAHLAAARRQVAATGGAGEAGPATASGDAEAERLRGLVSRALSALVPQATVHVHVTAQPATVEPPSTVAATHADAPAEPDPIPSAGPPREDAATSPLPFTMPREGWLALTSVLVGLLAGVTWWAGSRDRPGTDTADADDADGTVERRMAA